MVGNEPGVEQTDAIVVFDQVMSTAAPCTTAWEEVGLSALRPSLDEQALAIAEHQESSLESRRALAAQAKSFRLAVEAEFGATSDMRTSSGELVRAFKGEIDSLTTRSRFAETAFLSLYKLLREAPDPAVTVQALEGAAKAAVELLEDRNRSLEEQRLEASRQLEAARATARESVISPEEMQEEKRALRAEVAAEQAETEQLRLLALQDAVQEELLLAQRQSEHERAAGQAQLQVLQQEVERLEARAAMVEEEAGRACRLEEEAAAREAHVGVLQDKVEALETEHDKLSARTVAAVKAEERANAECAEARARADSTEGGLGKRVQGLEAEAAQLRRELETRADATEVEGMRETIRILEGIWGDDGGDCDAKGGEKGSTKRNYRRHNDAATAGGGRFHEEDETEEKTEAAASAATAAAGGGAAGGGGGGEGRAAGAAGAGSAAAGTGGKRRRHGGVGKAVAEEENSDQGDSDRDVFATGGNNTTGDNANVPIDKEEEGDGAGHHRDDNLIPGAGAEGGARRGDVALAEGSGKIPARRGGEAEAEEGEGDAGVDAWLISYNRRLKNELERLRGRTRTAEDRLRNVEEERAAENAELVERRQDVKRLEQDLVDAHQVVEAGKTMLRAFQSGPVAKQFGKLVGRGGLRGGSNDAELGLEDSCLEGFEEGGADDGVPDSEGFSAADRLLGAVKRQRDRFRKEALRREREASIAKGNSEHLTRDNQELRKENMHLYKKIRFVMSYGGKGGRSEEESGGGSGGAERATESKYEQMYENELDPFKEFDSQEKAARRGQMRFLERWLFWASGNVLRNSFRRHVLLVYLLVVHGVMLLMLGGGEGSAPSLGNVAGVDGVSTT